MHYRIPINKRGLGFFLSVFALAARIQREMPLWVNESTRRAKVDPEAIIFGFNMPIIQDITLMPITPFDELAWSTPQSERIELDKSYRIAYDISDDIFKVVDMYLGYGERSNTMCYVVLQKISKTGN